MSEGRRTSARSARSSKADRSIFDHLRIVRRHWLLAGIVFLLSVAGALAWVLFDTPVYESFATVRIEDGAGTQSVLNELAEFDKPSSLEAEMTEMLSSKVATLAAQDPDSQATSLIQERNGYRPFNVLLRTFRGESGPTVLELTSASVVEKPVRLVLRFGDAGRTLVVEDASGNEETVAPFAAGTPFTIHGVTLTIQAIHGMPDGRTFDALLQPVKDAAAWIRRGAYVKEVSERTGIVSLGFRSDTPHVAQRISNALADAYLVHAGATQEKHLQEAVLFLEAEATRLKGMITKIQTERDDYIRSQGAHQLAGAATDTRAQLIEIRSRRAERLRAKAAKRWHLESWKREVGLEERLALLASDSTDPMTMSVATEYAALQRQLKVLLSPGPDRQTPDSPQVLSLKTRLDAARDQLRDRLVVVARTRIAQIRRDLEDIDAEITEIDGVIGRYESELAKIPAIETRLAEFTREIESRKVVFETLVERELEARIALNSESKGQRILDRAFLPGGRKSPRLFRTGMLGVALGLILALGIAILRDMSNRSVRSPRELEEDLGLQMYATIPHFRRLARRHRKRLKDGLVMLEAPASVAAEAYRTLWANIRFGADDRAVKTLAITSATPSEGKTVTTLNLAVAMARGGARVLVIDADLRRSRVHVQMQVPREPGLVDTLAFDRAWEEVVQKSSVPGLDVITAGAQTSEPGALLESARFRELLASLAAKYDHILFDVPPVLAVADVASFFRRLDGVILLARDQRCPLPTIRAALEQVERLGGNVLGAIYNAYDPRRVSEGEYGYYGYGGAYGGYAEQRK